MIPVKFQVNITTVQMLKGDITEIEIDAIVNAANSSLMGGGGVDGAIHRKGGKRILEECKKIRQKVWPDGLPTGHAVITTAGDLKAKKVIHTVGPVWQGGNQDEEKLLTNVYFNSLKLAVSKGLRTIAFPSISTGAYRYPIEKASLVALRTTKAFLEIDKNLKEVVFVLFSTHDFKVYLKSARDIIGKKM